MVEIRIFLAEIDERLQGKMGEGKSNGSFKARKVISSEYNLNGTALL